MHAFNTIKTQPIRRSLLVYICALMLLLSASVAANEAGVLDEPHIQERMSRDERGSRAASTRESLPTVGARTDQAQACGYISDTGRVCPLPDDNLIRNPWFRTGNRPSLDGWIVVGPTGDGWEPSQKPGNPTPNDVVGTAARISTGRGNARTGRTIDPNEFTSLIQVVPADPARRVLNFDMYWVAHTVDPVVVTVYGGPTREGPWSEVWTPFHQRHTRVIRPESGRGNDLWGYYSGLTSQVTTTLEQGYPYYKVEIAASLPDQHGGLKVTGVYFSTADSTADSAADTTVVRHAASRNPLMEEGEGGSDQREIVIGLQETVEIVRDTWGVAHVYSDTDAGAFFGAGYATAQDRMLQMELTRRAAAGRLSEVLGSNWVEYDKRARTIGLNRHAQRVAQHLTPDVREALEAYVAGINHYLNTETENMEAVFSEHKWTPEPWTVADSIAVWMRLSEFFDRSWENQVTALRNHEEPASQDTRRGFRVIDEAAVVVTEADFARTNPEAYRRLKARSVQANTEGYVWEGLKASHAWAVSGARTITGKPLLESDPQIPVTLPSLWYEIHLHGESFNARGIGVAGAPGFLVGWNEHLAWGATALGSDNVDLFLERLDANGSFYAYQNDWLPLETRVERIDVLGADPVYITVRETQHGPLVDDLLPNRRRDEHFSLRYVVTQELHTSIDGLLAMMRATDWESFQDGLRRYHSPGLHIVYADVHGNIGYHTAAAIPIRKGTYGLPQVGWTGDEEWAGYIPFDELPQSLNPERGFVASANHLPVGDWYPYNLTVASSGHNPRSLRLYELLSERDDFSVEVFEQGVHRDNISPVARDFVHLANLLNGRNLLTPQAARVLDTLADWDGRMIQGDPQSELGEVLLSTMHRSLGAIPGTERLAARFGGGFPGIIHLFRVVLAEHEQHNASDWDPDVARWMSAILEQIGSQVRRSAARVPQPQRMLYQTNQEGFGSLNPAADRVMPDLTTVFVDTIWSQAGNSYTHIVDLGDLDNSRAVLPPGISENPRSPHYFDQVDLWASGATRPAPLSRDAVMAHAESVQTILFQRRERAYLEPPDGYVYHGTSPHLPDVEAYIAALGDPAIFPAVEGMHSGVPGTRPQFLERTTRDFLERVRAAGRIPHLSFSMSIGDGEAVDDVIALTDTYDELIRTVARVIRDFGDPVFVRIGFEFNGSWNHYHPGLYPVAFRKFVDLLREEGATNFATIWCYEPNGPGDFDAVGPDGEYLWYPGDEYVDWFGIDLFQHGHFVADADSGRGGRQDAGPGRSGGRVQESTYQRTVRFLDMAEKHGKPVFLSELAAVDAHLTPDHLDPDLADGKSDWELWFEPFFALLAEYPQIKGFNYMSQDYRATKYAAVGWGDARIQVNSYVLEQWIEALRDDRFLHAGMKVD